VQKVVSRYRPAPVAAKVVTPAHGGGLTRVQPMMWQRVLGAVGRLMVAAGVVLLLFVAYQLWGTGLQTQAAQAQLRQTFGNELQQITELPDDDVARAEATAAALRSLAIGDAVGQLEIPAIGVDYIVLEGVDLGTLESGPGHFPQTPLPGQPGNTAIAGHRATFDAPFNRLDELVPGDEVRVTTLQGTFVYEVLPQQRPGAVDGDDPIGHYLVSPTAVEILDDKGDNRITLMGCHPRYGSSQRIVVEGRLIGMAAPATPAAVATAADGEPDGAVLLRGDKGSWVPVLAWSAAVLALCAVAWLLARRWNRWLVYLVALPVVGVVLFQAFEAVAQLSPVAY
jgi:sortase A